MAKADLDIMFFAEAINPTESMFMTAAEYKHPPLFLGSIVYEDI